MKKRSIKIVGLILFVMLIATIGVFIVGAETDETSESGTDCVNWGFKRLPLCRQFGREFGVFKSQLTEEQIEVIKETLNELKKSEATPEEIHEVMQAMLEEYGVDVPTRDEILDKNIENAEKRLEILKRTKELRQNNSELSWEEIDEIIQEEFELELPENEGYNMRFGRGFGWGHCEGPHGFVSDEEYDL